MSNGVKTYKVVHFNDLRGNPRGFSSAYLHQVRQLAALK
jgi:hypothetical protein